MSMSNSEAREQRQGILWRAAGAAAEAGGRERPRPHGGADRGARGAPRDSNGRGHPDEFERQERAVLGNVLKLRDKTADDVMVPRADIMAMPEDFTLEQAIGLIQRDGH